MKAGYPPIDIKFTDRKAYYDALEIYQLKHDINPLVSLLAKYLYERLKELIDILSY